MVTGKDIAVRPISIGFSVETAVCTDRSGIFTGFQELMQIYPENMSGPSSNLMNEHPHRTHTCGELSDIQLSDIHLGDNVVLKGWVDTRRDLGGVIFVDLRDRYGLTQVVFSPQDNVAAHDLADRLRSEYVVSVIGVVAPRSSETINPNLSTGTIEVRVESLIILAEIRTYTLPRVCTYTKD